MKQIKKYYWVVIFFWFLFFFIPSKTIVWADNEYKTEYKVEYFPDLKGDCQVKLNIKITNLLTEVYVKELNLIFPKNFLIDNISAADDHQKISPILEENEKQIKLKLIFSSPNIGRGSENNFYLSFFQKNLFKINGNVWEIILPIIDDPKKSNFNIIFHLPENTHKKLSIAKPKPDLIQENKIYWNNVKTKIIYAVFGSSQFYRVNLTYHLQNDKLFPIYFDVAFPPETLYQKVFLKSIEPLPTEVLIDEDGNYLGRYILKAKEGKEVVFDGVIEILSQPQEELFQFIRKKFDSQKKYLLSPTSFWSLNQKIINRNEFLLLKNVEDIYRFVVNKLNYDYKKIKKNNKRLGAEEALNKPEEAVCTEFTDTFIALAREKGIYAREINGYGLSDDPELRPVSLISDILHAWPEYFDEKKQIWIPVDPTWEKTSGIDYFNSFDLNHLSFVIHGKNSTFPLSAGMYKIEDSKDIMVQATFQLPQAKIQLIIDDSKIKGKIFDGKEYQGKISITNRGNVFIKNSNLELKSKFLEFSPNRLNILLLAPYQRIEYQIKYKSKARNINKKEEIIFTLNNQSIKTKKIEIVNFYQDLLLKNLSLFSFFLILIILILIIKKKHGVNK